MRYLYYLLISLFFCSCSFKNQIIYLKDVKKQKSNSWSDFSVIKNNIESGDILKIDVASIVQEAALPYNQNSFTKNNQNNLDIIKLDGYLVDEFKKINYPVLGSISVEGLSEGELEEKITKLLTEGNHLIKPTVKVRRINSKFTVLGEVRSPGTYSFLDNRINIFQALGYAGDLTIDGKRNDVILIREKNGVRSVFEVELTNSELLNSPSYYIKNNDVIIVNPTFNKVKSAGFVGSPSSIASIASILLSITLLLIN